MTVVSEADLGERLAAAVSGPVRPGGEADVIGPGTTGIGPGSVQPAWVVTPTDTAEVSAVMALASSFRLAVVARGSGTTLSWGMAPERADIIVDTTALSGIVEHVAGDLVVAVGAGTRLVDLQVALAHSGQRLALDGDHGDATVGGLLANGISGPSRLLHGTLRDLLIGATMVRADGVVAHTGGKVVKNVAGYDLGKLLHGSWGTLAIITEAVFRLHPIPPDRRWVTVDAQSPVDVAALARRVLGAQAVPAALELDRPPDAAGELAVMLEGPVATVGARADAVAALLGARARQRSSAPSWWGRRPAMGGDVMIRLTTEVAGIGKLLAAADAAAALSTPPLAVHLRGSAGVGALVAGIAASSNAFAVKTFVDRLRRSSSEWGGSVVVVDGPADRLADVDRWGPVPGLEIMRRIKHGFDPQRLLAPGRFVGGI